MFKELIKVFFQSAVYGLTGVASTFISIFLVPIYTRILTPADYGVIALLSTLSSVILIFAGMGMGTAVFWAYFRAKEEERSKVFFTSFLFQTVFSLLIALLFYFSAGLINRILFGGADYTLLVRLSAGAIFFGAGTAIPLALLRAEKAPSKYVLVTLFQALAAVVLSVWFVVFLRWGLAGAFWANLGSAIVGYGLGLAVTTRRIRLKFSAFWLKEMLAYGAPLMPAGLAMWLLNSSDRYFLNSFASTADVGIYNVGYKVGMLVTLVTGAFQLAYGPFVYSIFNEKRNARDYYRKIATYFLLFLVFIALIVSVFAKEIIQVFTGPNFHLSYVVVPFIAFSYVAYGLYNVFGTGIAVMRKTYFVTLAVFIAGASNLVLNYILIRRMGMIGAAVSTLISFLVLALVQLRFSQRVYRIPFEFKRLLVVLVIGGGLTYISTLINFGLVPSLLAKSLLVILFPILLYATKFFDKRELNKLMAVWAAIKHSRGNPKALLYFIKESLIT